MSENPIYHHKKYIAKMLVKVKSHFSILFISSYKYICFFDKLGFVFFSLHQKYKNEYACLYMKFHNSFDFWEAKDQIGAVININ